MGIPLLLKKAGAVFAVFVIFCLSLPQEALAGDWFTEIREDYQDRFGDSADPYADGTGEALEQPEAEPPAPPDSGTGIPDDWFDEIKTGYEEPEAGEPAVTAPEKQESDMDDAAEPAEEQPLQLWDEAAAPQETLPEDPEDIPTGPAGEEQQGQPEAETPAELPAQPDTAQAAHDALVRDEVIARGSVSTSEAFDFIVSTAQGFAVITRYNGFAEVLTVPSVLNGYPVEYIGDGAFADCIGLTSVTLPNGIRELGDFVFLGCENLKTINLPSGLSVIGEGSFTDCSALEGLILPDALTALDASLFRNCDKLKTIVIHDKVTAIGNEAFRSCGNLSEVTVPESVQHIGEDVFADSTQIFLRVYGGSFAHQYAERNAMKYRLVKDTEGLQYSLSIPEGHATITKYTGTAKGLIIPSELDGHPVRHIGARAFQDCGTLWSLTLPEGLETIGEYAFYGCSKIREMSIPQGVISIGDLAFTGCQNIIRLVLPQSVQNIGRWAFSMSYGLKEIVLSPDITEIPEGMFYMCESLEAIVIPDKVTFIGDDAFYYCKNLNEITIPASVQEIDFDPFFLCDRITFKVHERSYAQEYAIDNGYRYTIITSGAVMRGGDFDFTVQPEGYAAISAYAGKATELAVPSILNGYLVKSIGTGAFANQHGLSKVTLPDTITALGDNAFDGCSQLEEITLPARLESIGGGAFSFCRALKSIVLPDNLTIIKTSMFEQCENLERFSVPDKVTRIEESAFMRCYGLKEVRIPSSVESIADNAFAQSNKVSLLVSEGSYAQEYAVSMGIPYTNIR